MRESENHHRSPRIKTRFETLYCFQREEGAGVLADISHSGALVEDATVRPGLGTPMRVHVFLAGQAEPFELVGQVVRHTGSGFAIEYEKLSPEVVGFIDDAAAILKPLTDAPGGPRASG